MGIDDEKFYRIKSVPMTKSEIRTVSLSKMHLTEESIVWDIGAGSGSVTVEAALLCRKGKVFAIEMREDAIEVIEENVKRFDVHNVDILQAEAPCCLEEIPTPDCVFIGGSNGKLNEIIEFIYKKNKHARIVINAVTLETQNEILKLLSLHPEMSDVNLLQMAITRYKEVGNYHMPDVLSPVMIVSFNLS